MKVTEIDMWLTLNDEGDPVIQFPHTENSSALADKTLGVFIKRIQENGLELINEGDCSGRCLKETLYTIKPL